MLNASNSLLLTMLLLSVAALLSPLQVLAEAAPGAELGRLSDAELTNLAAGWEQLDAEERANLIQETLERMQPPGRQQLPAGRSVPNLSAPNLSTPNQAAPNPSAGARAGQSDTRRSIQQLTANTRSGSASSPRQADQVTVRTERRRYGRVVRKADGSVVRIETRVVQVQTRDPKRAYGMGFESRHHQQRPQPETAPVRRDVITVQGAPDATP